MTKESTNQTKLKRKKSVAHFNWSSEFTCDARISYHCQDWIKMRTIGQNTVPTCKNVKCQMLTNKNTHFAHVLMVLLTYKHHGNYVTETSSHAQNSVHAGRRLACNVFTHRCALFCPTNLVLIQSWPWCKISAYHEHKTLHYQVPEWHT